LVEERADALGWFGELTVRLADVSAEARAQASNFQEPEQLRASSVSEVRLTPLD
jgi:hypothetical protein